MRSRSERRHGVGARLVCVVALAALASVSGASSIALADPPASPASPSASAPVATSAPADPPSVDVMHILAAHGVHDLEDERYNVYGQISLIGDGKAPFSAKYTNLNGSTKSLLPNAEGSWSGTTTLFVGGKLWKGAEAYVVPEIISERPFSGLAGLGGAIQNGELQKGGLPSPTVYLSRAYIRQTFDLGGDATEKKSAPRQLGMKVGSDRLTLIVGKFSTIDFFDQNGVAADPRRQFLGIGFMTHPAWDFAADARGYTWGGIAELYLGDFSFRVGHTLVPLNPNDLTMDYRFWKFFGDQVEIAHEHTIKGQHGAVRLLGYRNYENMGRFDDAVAIHDANPNRSAAAANPVNHPGNCPNYTDTPGYDGAYTSTNPHAPDLCWARKPNQKLGIGINLEQMIADEIGLFFRGMYADGQTEVYAFVSADRSLSFGGWAKGDWWRRPLDLVGAAFGMSWISSAHATYLAQGGIDGFIGDGRLRQSEEATFEVFYSVNLAAPMWLTLDYQHIVNPAYNADRGPVDVGGGRLHVEF